MKLPQDLPEEFEEWRVSPRTRRVADFLEQMQVPAQLNSLLSACATSTDPRVREVYAYYLVTQQTLAWLKGRPNERSGT